MITKPFLKWVGGKTQIIEQLREMIPKKIVNYHEPFLGGGSVLLLILSMERNKEIIIENKIYAYDLNKHLINVYKTIQLSKDELFSEINAYINTYDKLKDYKGPDKPNRIPKTLEEAKTYKETYYYWLRSKFNELNKESKRPVKRASLFIVLNKLCFRGVYREGPRGFNVPFGHYKKTPTIITEEHLNEIHELIKKVEFRCSDFSESFKNIKAGDFVYLDPPYAPETKKSFVGYTKKGFTLDKHNELFDLIKSFDGIFMMSNSNVELVTEAFKKYTIKEILCKRSINSKNPGAKTMEIIITNY